MSEMIIEIKNKGNNPNQINRVYVEGKFAYTTNNSATLELINLKKVFELLYIENIKFRIKE